MTLSDYEKKFSESVRLVPYIQADEVLKCKRFLSGLQHRIRVHLSVVSENRFEDLVEATLRVEQSTTAMYQSKLESKSKRSAPGISQQSSGQYNRKKSKDRGYRGRGAGRGAISTQGSVRPRLLAVTPRLFLPFVICVRNETMGSAGDSFRGVSTVARKAILLGSVLS